MADELFQLRAALAHKQGLLEDVARDCERAERALDQAEARIDQLTDALALRSAALNRTAASNDTMRAQLDVIAAAYTRHYGRLPLAFIAEASRGLKAILDNQETPSE